jgi:hypothetical protein
MSQTMEETRKRGGRYKDVWSQNTRLCFSLKEKEIQNSNVIGRRHSVHAVC